MGTSATPTSTPKPYDLQALGHAPSEIVSTKEILSQLYIIPICASLEDTFKWKNLDTQESSPPPFPIYGRLATPPLHIENLIRWFPCFAEINEKREDFDLWRNT